MSNASPQTRKMSSTDSILQVTFFFGRRLDSKQYYRRFMDGAML